MNEFIIKIAGLNIKISGIHEYSYLMCKPFIVDEINEPDLQIKIIEEDIEKEKGVDQSVKVGFGRENEVYEFLALLSKIAEKLIDRDILLIHGAAISVDQVAYLFSGKSGTGKTSHVCKWMIYRPDLEIINGDKPFIRVGSPSLICGSPWCGKEGFCTNVMRPLKSIVFMERSNENNIRKVSFGDAFPELLQSVYYPEDNRKRVKLIQLLQALGEKVDFYKFEMNNLKEDCFDVAYNALHGESQI